LRLPLSLARRSWLPMRRGAYVDLNRACDELDPAVIEGVKSLGVNARIASGLGGCAAGRGNWHSDLSREDQPCGGRKSVLTAFGGHITIS